MQLPPEKRDEFNHSFSEFLAASTKDNFLQRLGIKVEAPASEVVPAVPADNQKQEVVEQ